MTFDYRDPRDRVGETERATVGRKIKSPRYLETVVAQFPVSVQRLQQRRSLVSSQRLDATFAGFTAAIGKLFCHARDYKWSEPFLRLRRWSRVEKSRPRRAGRQETRNESGI